MKNKLRYINTIAKNSFHEDRYDSHNKYLKTDTGFDKIFYLFDFIPLNDIWYYNKFYSTNFSLIEDFNSERINTLESNLKINEIENNNNLEFLIGKGNYNSDYYNIKYNLNSDNLNLLVNVEYHKTDGYKDFLWYKNEPISYFINGNYKNGKHNLHIFTLDNKFLRGHKTTDNDDIDYLNNLWIYDNSDALLDTSEFRLGRKKIKKKLYPKDKLTLTQNYFGNNINYIKYSYNINDILKYNLEYFNTVGGGGSSYFNDERNINEPEDKPIVDFKNEYNANGYTEINNYIYNSETILKNNGIKSSINYNVTNLNSEIGFNIVNFERERYRLVRNYLLTNKDYKESLTNDYSFFYNNIEITKDKDKHIDYKQNIEMIEQKYFVNNKYKNNKLTVNIDADLKNREITDTNYTINKNSEIIGNPIIGSYKYPSIFSIRNNIEYELLDNLILKSKLEFNKYFQSIYGKISFIGKIQDTINKGINKSNDISIGLKYNINVNTVLEMNYININ